MKVLRFLFLFVFCKLSAQEKTFKLIPTDSSGLYFNNVVIDNQRLNVISYEYFYNGGATCLGDINNDGLPDLFFTSNEFECRLFLNLGNLKFKDITKESQIADPIGYHTGAVMVDINNDGWLDIYICKSVFKENKHKKNKLFVNNKNGTFTEMAEKYGLADFGYATQIYFNDMDQDGDLDAYILNHPYNLNNAKTIRLGYNKKMQIEVKKDPPLPEETCRYYENVNGFFVDKTQQAGLTTKAFALSAILEDFNNDGLVDIYQCNDYLEPDYLFINKGNGKFINQYDSFFKHGSFSSMGSYFEDLNNDGYNDLITVDMLPDNPRRQKMLRRSNSYDEYEMYVKYGFGLQFAKNSVQLNNRNNTFSDISYLTGMAFSDWSWGVVMADFDNDSKKDVYIANGYMRDITDMDFIRFQMDSIKKALGFSKSNEDVLNILSEIPSAKIRDFYFKNYGNLNFKKYTKEIGINENTWSYSTVFADLDNDGDLELVVNNCNDYPFLYKNNTVENQAGNFLRVKLKGTAKNPFGIGCKIALYLKDSLYQTTTCNPFKGYLSSQDYRLHFGCEQHKALTVKATWPNGMEQVIENVGVNQEITIDIQNASHPISSKKEIISFLEDRTQAIGLKFKHQENPHIDFKLEPLLPYKLSQEGPAIAVADINNDQKDDIIIGGSKDVATICFIQTSEGKFIEKKSMDFEKDKLFEDGSILAHDLDKDGDLDLLIATGGNDYPRDSLKYPLRIYLNNGQGTFSKMNIKKTLYTSAHSLSVVDLDKDGQSEFFIGGRSIPGNYGQTPSSYLFQIKQNDIVLLPQSSAFQKQGMVTSSYWSDIDGNGYSDLVTAGHWMPVQVFYNYAGVLESNPRPLSENQNGWWNCILPVDIDNDGDLDIAAGNLGLNSRYVAPEGNPMTMHVNDYDRNGSTDIIISTFMKDKMYPIAIRDYVLDQMPMLRKRYLRYHQYADAQINTMFSPQEREGENLFTAHNMKSGIFINDKGTFTFQSFDNHAQFSPIKAIQALDLDKDGLKDLLLTGNNYATEVETGRDDANIGLVLKNETTHFKSLTVDQSGFYTPHDAKDIKPIKINNRLCFVIANNNAPIQIVCRNEYDR